MIVCETCRRLAHTINGALTRRRTCLPLASLINMWPANFARRHICRGPKSRRQTGLGGCGSLNSQPYIYRLVIAVYYGGLYCRDNSHLKAGLAATVWQTDTPLALAAATAAAAASLHTNEKLCHCLLSSPRCLDLCT